MKLVPAQKASQNTNENRKTTYTATYLQHDEWRQQGLMILSHSLNQRLKEMAILVMGVETTHGKGLLQATIQAQEVGIQRPLQRVVTLC